MKSVAKIKEIFSLPYLYEGEKGNEQVEQLLTVSKRNHIRNPNKQKEKLEEREETDQLHNPASEKDPGFYALA